MVTVTVQPAGLLVCFMIFITGRASGKGASRSAAVMVCSRPKAIKGKKMTPSILARFRAPDILFVPLNYLPSSTRRLEGYWTHVYLKIDRLC